MLRIAFASTDHIHVDLHFGGAEQLVIFDVAPGQADLIGVASFAKAEQVGAEGRVGLVGTVQDKVLAKLDFVEGCAAVYAASIGVSSVKRLMSLGIQPIIVDKDHEILDLLNEVSLALVYGGLAWVEKAKAKAEAETGGDKPAPAIVFDDSRHLVTSIDDLE